MTPDGRRALAFAAILGGSIVMTGYAFIVLILVRGIADKAFWLGMAAMGIIFTCITGFIALFVKRTVKVGKDGIEVSDQGGEG
jgi:hypothetical protein